MIVSFLPLVSVDEWWVRMWDFPRLQVAALLAVVMAQVLWLRGRRGKASWISLGAGGAALFWQLSHFAAYLPVAPKQVASAANCPPGRMLTLLHANVLQTNREHMAVLDMVKKVDADIVLLVETGPEWEAVLAPIAPRYPFVAAEAVPNTYGMILLSKLPMRALVKHRLQPGVPSIDARLRLPAGDVVDLYAVHPEPPIPGNDSGQRDAELVTVGRDVRARGGAAIVIGDLNDVAWSSTSRLFRELSAMGDPRAGRGLYPTFNARLPLLRWPLDHLFVTPHFALLAIDRLADINSDHFPMLFKLCLTGDAGARHAPATAPKDVRDDAREQLREGREAAAEEAGGG